MPSIANLPDDERADLISRLRKIEGQARGIQKMIDEGRDCQDVINQVAAMRAAANGLSGALLESFALNCLRHPDTFASKEQAVKAAVDAFVKSGR